MNWLKLTCYVLLLASLSACANTSPDLKSPCVGAQGSPCDDRTPVNDWWLGKAAKPV